MGFGGAKTHGPPRAARNLATPLPRGATALYSVLVNWTHNFPIERRNFITEPSLPQRNLLRQRLGVRLCYDVPLGSYWGTNDRR